MKRLILSLAATSLLTTAYAQNYICVTGESPIPIDEVEKITYETDKVFYANMLANLLTSDPKLTIFGEALKKTELADTLQLYWKPDYVPSQTEPYYYKANLWNEVAVFDKYRRRQFTVFAETDSVFAAQGINSLADLQAYAKQVYDEAFPEDAAISDPTDRRNSLNRFMAYHVLGHGSDYYWLTGEDGNLMSNFYDRDMADIAAWYATLMPQGALKCSYPLGSESGLYLNRRGLKDGPDKYGSQIRGAKIQEDLASKAYDHHTHMATNGYYFYIDRVLAYDRQTREEVLGGERWRVDCTTLSPDILNVDTKQREAMSFDGSPSTPDISLASHAFAWDIENFTATLANSPLVARRSHCNWWCYDGDEMRINGDFDITIKLPPLPAGEWEIRLGGCCVGEYNPKVKAYINGQQTTEEIDLALLYYDGMPNEQLPDGYSDTMPKKLGPPTDCGHFTVNPLTFYRHSDDGRLLRSVLGRVKTDGKTDTFLRIATIPSPTVGNMTEMLLDFLEFCPVSVCDNKEIPED